MTHIFGLEHTLGGIRGQISDFFTGDLRVPDGGFVPTDSLLADTFVPVPGADVYGPLPVPTTNVRRCGPSAKTKRFITTVCPDGTTTTREAKSRKRKRRLASLSDIKDIAALKQVLGGGKALDTWIATRGR